MAEDYQMLEELGSELHLSINTNPKAITHTDLRWLLRYCLPRYPEVYGRLRCHQAH